MSSIATFYALLTIVPFSSGEPTECRKYKILSGADRATSFNNASRYSCDDLLSNGWYRMAGEAGDHIPEKCVPKRHCGTHAPGWLDGKHPTVQEGLVTRRVCYHWRSSCCQWENNVTIRNCGNYCVYKLRRPPVCHLRYCGESDALKTKQLQVQLSCNGVLSVFDTHTGKLVVLSNSAANISSNYTLSPDSPVLAVRCRNYGSKPWIIGSASNGLLTDTRWKCTSLPTHDMKDLSWTAEDFDDSHWAQAVSNVSKRDETPWGKVPDISVEALWISTADEYHSRLFCRRRLSEVSLRQSKSNGFFQATLDYVDHALSRGPRSQHVVNDVMQCFKKCRDDPQCFSFNFEYASLLPTKKCELNGVTKDQDPENYIKRPGYTYYESVG